MSDETERWSHDLWITQKKKNDSATENAESILHSHVSGNFSFSLSWSGDTEYYWKKVLGICGDHWLFPILEQGFRALINTPKETL